MNLNDAYKTISYSIRFLITAATGKVVGSLDIDDALGDAAGEIKPAVALATEDPALGVLVHALAGAWGALKSMHGYESTRGEAEYIEDDIIDFGGSPSGDDDYA